MMCNQYVNLIMKTTAVTSYTNKAGPNLASEMAIYVTKKTRGSQEPVIAYLVFNLTSKVDRKWGCYTQF